jgi:PAS domain S-box-containing protein
VSTSAAANRSPRLILRFAMYSAIALLLAGGGILWFARHAAESRSEREVLEHAETTSALIADRLQASDFAAPVSNSRRTELDDLFAPLLGGEVVRVKLWSENGTITYSNDASLIGAHHPEASVAGAFAGMAESEIGGLNDDGGGAGENIKVLSAYVPVRLGGSQQPTGALELYTSFDEVTADAMATVKPVAVALALALLLLYASLFPILRQVTGALEARTRKLQQQSDELEKTIGERRQALASLREADARYRALVEELPLVSYVSALDTPGFSSYVSPQLEDLLGYTPEEWLETPGLFWDVIHEDDAERVRNEHRIGYANAETFSTQYRMRAKGGRVIWVEDQIRVIHDREGKRALAQGFLIDITARKNTEIALTENEARFRGLVGNIPGVVFRCDIDSDWTMEFLSDPIEELVGYPSSDFIDNRARTFASVIHPDDRAGLEAEVASSVADRKAYTTDYRVIHRDGSVRYVIERGQAILAADGRIRLDGAIFDVTDRRLAENERLKLAGIVESSDDAITSADLDGIVTSWNNGAERMFGYTAEEMIGQSGEILVPEGEKLDPTARIAMVVEMGEGRFEATRRRKDGTLIDIAVTMSAVCNAAGEVIAVAAIAQDITDRKRVEQERAQFTRELEVQNERLLELDRVRGTRLPRAPHAADLDSRLPRARARRRGRQGDRRAAPVPRRRRAKCEPAPRSRRRPPLPRPDRSREAHPRGGRRRPRGGGRRVGRDLPPSRRGEGHHAHAGDESAPAPGRRPRPARSVARQPRLERDQVHAGGRARRRARELGSGKRRPRSARHGHGHLGRRARAGLRALLPHLAGDRAGDSGDGARPRDLEGDRARPRRPDHACKQRRRGSDLPRRYPDPRRQAPNGGAGRDRLVTARPLALIDVSMPDELRSWIQAALGL